MIEGGFYLKARCIQDADIAHAPPHVREIWDWLLMKAMFTDGKNLQRGQVLTSYQEIRDGLAWKVGYRTERYSKNDCETAMNWLKKHTMAHTTKTTGGMIITIEKYSYYQDIKNYESYTKAYAAHTMNIQRTATIDKKEKNVIKKEALSSKEDIPFSDIVSHLNTRTKKAYRDTGAKIRSLITARWNEGFRVPDFERVIDNQVIKWEHDPKMREFLRPETIFGTKFESYLNAVPNMAQAGLVSAGTQSLLSWAERKMKEAEDANGRQPEIRGIDGSVV